MKVNIYDGIITLVDIDVNRHKREWCQQAIQNPVRREIEPNGRIRHWFFISELGRYLRVVTLDDGETIHNAFSDRNFKE